MRRTIFKVLAYAIYGFLAFAVFLYVMLPYDLIRQRIVEAASQGPVKLSIASLSPTFPPGLDLQDVSVEQRQTNAAPKLYRLTTLHIRPQWLALFSRAKSMRLNGELYNGQMSGNMRYAQSDGAAAWEILADFQDLDVARHDLLIDMEQKKKLTVQGRLSGTANVRLSAAGEFQQADIAFEIKPAILTPGEASRLLVRKQLPCDNLNGAGVLTQREWQIEELTCRGDDIFIDLRGTFRPRSPWPSSVPNLRVALKSETAFQPELNLISQWALQRPPGPEGTVKFGLRGRLDNPRPVR